MLGALPGHEPPVGLIAKVQQDVLADFVVDTAQLAVLHKDIGRPGFGNDGDGICSQRTAKQQGKCEQKLDCWLHGAV
ncbi:hypothetical protein ULF88_13700 [Halopseudomonas pachastrellae]|nr:hypothetical protein [Halopseudomonas pachastrellae]